MGRSLLLFVAVSVHFGLAPQKGLSNNKVMQELTLSMWARSEMRTDSVNILDVGTGDGRFMPKIVNFFEVNLGIPVDKIVGIDTGVEQKGRKDGPEQVQKWNKQLKKMYGGRFEIKYMDIKDISQLECKFHYVFFIAPFPPQDTGRRVREILKVMTDDGILSIVPFSGERDLIKRMLWIEGVEYTESDAALSVSGFPLDPVAFIVKRSELRNSETAKIFGGLMVKRILEMSA